MSKQTIPMKKILVQTRIWIFANILGIFLYLYFASKIWIPIGEVGLEGGPGDPIIWALTAFPVLAVFFLVNLAWLFLIILKIRKNRDWRPIMMWLLIILIWLGTGYYYGHRQYAGSSMKNSVNLESDRFRLLRVVRSTHSHNV